VDRLSAALVAALTLALLGGDGRLEAQEPPRGTPLGVPAEALSRARTQGTVRVIVGLDTTLRSGGPESPPAGRPAIASAQAAVLARLTSVRSGRMRRFEYIPYLALEVDERDLQTLATQPEVRSIVLDAVFEPLLAQSTPLIGAVAAWNAGYTGAGWTIAILDSGVDKTHSFLAGKVVSEACYSTTFEGFSTSMCQGGASASTGPNAAIPCTLPECSHGTHVAGIAAGKGTSFSGVAKDATIIAIQVFSESTQCGARPAPCAVSFESDVIAGLERVYALRNTFNIAAANLSLGGGSFSSPCDGEATKAIVDRLRDVRIATVAASGNDGFTAAISSPACISTAVSVGSTTDGSSGSPADEVSYFTNSSQYLTLLAPGQTITSSVPGGGFADFDGTSMAAPHVSGAWAVLKSRRPAATVTEIVNVLTSTGVSIFDPGNGLTKRRIRVDAAIQALQPPCTYAVTPTTANVPRSGGTATITVTTGQGCRWSASSDAPFVSVTGGGTGSGTATITVSANPQVAPRHAVVTVAGTAVTVDQAGATPGDLNGDAHADLLWQHATTGALAAWYIRGRDVLATQRLSIDHVDDLNWQIAGGGDLNGDGVADLVWRHQVSGRLAVWYLSGATVIGTEPLSINAVTDIDWQIRGVGDTNGDGFADLVWQHRTQGRLAVWYMTGSQVVSTRPLSVPQVSDTAWQIAAAADINRDGKADLLWHNTTTGGLAAWLMDGDQVGTQQLLSVSGVPDLNWRLLGAGDTNADGYADLIWQNLATGEVGIWYLTNFTVIDTGKLTIGVGASSQWRVVGPG